MFQAGEIDFPMVEGYVHLTLARQNRSYKLAGARAPVGRISRDFFPAAAGEMGKNARLIPCTVTVKSESTGKTHTYNYEMIHDPLWTPRLIPTAIADSISTTEAETAEMMIDMSTRIHLKDCAEPVSLKNTFFESTGFFRGISEVFSAASRLMNNDFRRVRLERVVTKVSVRSGRETATSGTGTFGGTFKRQSAPD
jgi:hypothetical protein